tara:strand:- start:101 stop:652 length:552 start_codon:yes stop_codon:yes gene_type:complete
MMILMFLVVFRSSQKRKRWFTHGEKKSRTTNLDFPSVLLNQGLTEANNNTRAEETSFAFLFSQTRRRKKEEKGEMKREEKRQLTLLRARHDDAVCSSTRSATKQQRRERALHTQQEKQREYIKTRSQTTRSSPHRKRTNTDLSFKRAAQREKEEKHFKIERERSLKSARDLDLDVPIDRIEEV